jgi:hypothetical protein
MQKVIPLPPRQEPKTRKEGEQPESNKVKKKSFLSSLISTIFSKDSVEKKEAIEAIKEVQLSALKSQASFIAEYNKIIDKTSTLSRKQRDYVVAKVEEMINQGLIKKIEK